MQQVVASAALEVLALDRGPRLRNIAESLRDGFSTVGTAGVGFGAMRRLSDRFEVFSQLGRGTVVWVRLCPQLNTSSASHAFESGGASIALSVKKCR